MNRQTLHTLIAFLFIVSGATGLIYQIVWFKYLSLFLGNTTVAQTIVLATFMGGLAIGAWWWGRKADGVKQPLRLYAYLEFGIGIYCLIYPFLIAFLRDGFIAFVQSMNLASDGAAVAFLKLIISILSLLFPTALMGGTLPILVRTLSRKLDEAGKNVAQLYFLNSFGAVIGSALGGFFLVPMIGLKLSMFSSGTINIVLAIGALAIARLVLSENEKQQEHHDHAFSEQEAKLAIIVAGISGATAMVYEIGWVRLLIPVLGSSTYSFSLMLIAFITGITLGSFLVSLLINKTKNLVWLLAGCQAGVALAMMVTLPLYGRVPYYFIRLGNILNRTTETYPIFLSLEFILCLIIMVVPTIFLGMTLPIASRIATRSVTVMGKSIGNVFSVNTLGTVVGALMAGLVLIPLIGIKQTIELGVLINIVVAIKVAFSTSVIHKRWRPVLIGCLAGAGLLYGIFAPNWSQTVMLSGAFRMINKNIPPPDSFDQYEGLFVNDKQLYYEEGRSATVAVLQYKHERVLIVNGKADASSVTDLPSQTMMAQLPLLLQDNVERVFVIGLGSGVTLGSVLTHPVKSVDCAEISPEVVKASAFFNATSNDPLSDPRVTLSIDDALAFLKLTRNNYDVIISEPTNPWIAGVGNLYTSEFLQECKARLTKKGTMVQWFHLYEMNDETVKLALRTFRSVFPHVTIWQSLTTDIVLLGSLQPLELNEESLKQKLEIPEVRANLHRIGIDDVPTLLSLQVMTDVAVQQYTSAGPLNTEDRPLLEYWAPEAFFLNKGTPKFEAYDERIVFHHNKFLLTEYLRIHPLKDSERAAIGKLQSTPLRGSMALGYSMLKEYVSRNPQDDTVLYYLSRAAKYMGRNDEALSYLGSMVRLKPNDPNTLTEYASLKLDVEFDGASMMEGFNGSEIEKILQRIVVLTGDTLDTPHIRLGDLCYKTMRFKEAVAHYQRALVLRQTRPGDQDVRQDDLLLRFSRSWYRLGDRNNAIAYAAQASLENMNNASAIDFLNFLRGRIRVD